MDEVSVTKEKEYEMMGNLDENKTVGPDGVSGYILKKGRKRLVEPLLDILKCSLSIEKVP